MKKRTSFDVITAYLPERIRRVMRYVKSEVLSSISEIRLRSERPVSFVYPTECRFLTSDGQLTLNHNNDNCISASYQEISAAVESLCKYSVHSCARELSEGYFTIESGVRVGVAGYVSSEGIIREVSGLNFRVAREVKGCSEKIFNTCGSNSSVLICGEVNSGKTTMLRDFCRLNGNVCKTVLVDERNEVSATVHGIPENDVGCMTDVLVGYKRSEGITSALRTLSPDIIICDEISTQADVAAILSAHGSGVRLCASIHAGSYADLMRREVGRELVASGVFTHAVFLYGSERPSAVRGIRSLRNAS